MKHLIKSLITTIVLCIIIITWTDLNDNLGYGVLAVFLYVIPVVFAGGLIFFFYYFKFINRVLPIVIGYTILSLVAFGEDIYLYFRKEIGKDFPPKDTRNYYYFRKLDSNNLFDDPEFLTYEIDYVEIFHKLNTEQKITLKNIELIEYRVFRSDLDVFLNSKNELIFGFESFEDDRTFYKLDHYGNEIDKVGFGDGTFIFEGKIICLSRNSYSDWLENGDKSLKKLKIINKNLSFSSEEEQKKFDEIRSKKLPYIFTYDTIKDKNEEKSIVKMAYKENNEIFIFYNELNLRSTSYIDHLGDENQAILQRFFGEREEMQEIPLGEKLPFESSFSKRDSFNGGTWSGVLYSKIPIEGDTLWVARDIQCGPTENGKSLYYKHLKFKDNLEEIEIFANIIIYKNKNLHYQILRIEDHFFIAKKLDNKVSQNEKL